MNPHRYFDGPAAFGMRIRQLLGEIENQLQESLSRSGCNIPATTTGIALLLCGKENHSIAEVAKNLRYSHQLATKRMRVLEKLNFVKISDDPWDGRRRTVSLTSKGEAETAKLIGFLEDLEGAFQSAFDEIGVDALYVVTALDEAIRGHTLLARIRKPKDD